MNINIFNFLKESKILVVVKTKILPLIENYKAQLKVNLETYVKEKSPSAKVWIVAFLMSRIELPWYLKMFKGRVEKIIGNNFDKIADFILEKINQI